MKDIWSLLCCFCWRAFMNISLNIHVKEKMEFLYVSSWEFALLACCIYRGWSSEAHLKYTWTYSCACTSKNNPCVLAFVAWGARLQKMCFVLKNILFFLAIWDSPREVVIQLCISCSWLWRCDIILIQIVLSSECSQEHSFFVVLPECSQEHSFFVKPIFSS